MTCGVCDIDPTPCTADQSAPGPPEGSEKWAA